MEFHTITIEDDLDDLSADEATELLEKFQEAQEANKAQFEDASETVEEFSELDAEVTEDLVDNSPLSEQEVEPFSFSRKRDLLANFMADGDNENGNNNGGDESGPAEFGKQGETHDGDDKPEFVEESFSNINGVEL